MFITKIGFTIFIFIKLRLIFITRNWLLIWIWLECITLALIILLQPSRITPRRTEAVTKYFVMQAVASIIILFGILYRFYIKQTFDLYGVYKKIPHLCILLGIMTKLAVFPNPFWFVDVVTGIRLSRSFFLVIISKIAPLYLLFNLSRYKKFHLLCLIGLVSVIVGSTLGTNQTNIRKIIALSSIANLGWFVVCIPFMKGRLVLTCFLGYVRMICPVLWLAKTFSYKYLHKGSHLYHKFPRLLGLIVSLLALGGLPPFVGFFVKWLFFQRVVEFDLPWVTTTLIIGRLISLYFYLIICFNLCRIKWGDRSRKFSLTVLGTSSPSLFILANIGTIYTVMGALFVGPLVLMGEIP